MSYYNYRTYFFSVSQTVCLVRSFFAAQTNQITACCFHFLDETFAKLRVKTEFTQKANKNPFDSHFERILDKFESDLNGEESFTIWEYF